MEDNKTERAFKWIVGILQEKQISFQITGGLAARLYGSSRDLHDIDIDIHDQDFPKIIGNIREFITDGPKHFVDERWDCQLVILNYKGQVIELSGADNTYINDARTGERKKCNSDLSKSILINTYGITVPVEAPDDLIAYKSMLAGEHQKLDIQAISNYKNN